MSPSAPEADVAAVDETRRASEADPLETRGRDLAGEHRDAPRRRGRSLRGWLARVRENLESTYRDVRGRVAAATFPPGGAEWLLDNEYLVREALVDVENGLTAAFYRQIARAGMTGGVPRAYALAAAFAADERDQVDLGRFVRFVLAYQEVEPLTLGELWALPLLLRLVLLEDLVRSARPLFAREPDASSIADESHIAFCVMSLRQIRVQDWRDLVERTSRVDRVLREDPAALYGAMDFETRNRYRARVERLALRSRRAEEDVARAAISAAEAADDDLPESSHVGHDLLGRRRAALETSLGLGRGAAVMRAFGRRVGPAVFVAGTLALAAAAAWPAWAIARSWPTVAAVVALVAVATLAIDVSQAVIRHVAARLARPRALPKLEYRDGLPRDARTAVVRHVVLGPPASMHEPLRQLEVSYLGNRDPELVFAIVVDPFDADEATHPDDEAWRGLLRGAIDELNARHAVDGRPPPFAFLDRARTENPRERRWIGWERKRGKLAELNRLVLGEKSALRGDVDAVRGVRYVLTLDSDTVLPPGAAVRLAGTISHPLNRAWIPDGACRPAEGYSILQPRLEVAPECAERSPFTRVFGGDVTVDLYTHAVSDVYQDLFGNGIYAGKGIYDVAAFERCLAERVPENALLSHDLFEGVHTRAGLVSDVALFEDFPAHPIGFYRRFHRWVRGDWQLLPWLAPWVPSAGGRHARNDLPLLARFKILENLRRSVAPIAITVALALGWVVADGPLAWTGVVLALSLAPAALAFSGVALARWLTGLTFVPYEAAVAADAIARTLFRIFVSRRRLLQWVTAAHEARRTGADPPLLAYVREMGAAPGAGIALAIGLAFAAPGALAVAAPVLVLWTIAPFVARSLAEPTVGRAPEPSVGDRDALRRVARRTYLFYERFVTPADGWLPPDNYQEAPVARVAHRTSPTNVGFGLVSRLAAVDLGYATPYELVEGVRNALDVIEGLPRHRGHLLNWIDTQERRPLTPRYVSTADSGNFVACLMTLAAGLRRLPHAPVTGRSLRDGLLDTIRQLAEAAEVVVATVPDRGWALRDAVDRAIEAVETAPLDPAAWRETLDALRRTHVPSVQGAVIHVIDEAARRLDPGRLDPLHTWSERLEWHVAMLARESEALLAGERRLAELADARVVEAAGPGFPTLAELPPRARRLGVALGRLADEGDDPRVSARVRRTRHDIGRAAEAAEVLLRTIEEQASRIDALVAEHDFSFLYDRARHLFHIGYDLETGTTDPNHYDLFASESRLASFVAIALGGVPAEHWIHLGRPLRRIGGNRCLLSWGGTMFEYLMPNLFLPTPRGTPAERSGRAAVARQRSYAQIHRVPWGVSESGYNAVDADGNYQYRAFGVPGLGYRRGLEEDLVTAPYASVLALSVDPDAVIENLHELDRRGAMGPFGLYEAIDFTDERAAGEGAGAIVRSYMAHHQGMILAAITNALTGDAMVERFLSDRRVASARHLLHERIVGAIREEDLPADERVHVPRPTAAPPVPPWRVLATRGHPLLHPLSNGRLTTFVSAAGGGGLRWSGLALTRWRPDGAWDRHGVAHWVVDRDGDRKWSLALWPGPDEPDDHEVSFEAHLVRFRRREAEVVTTLEIAVAPDDDVEIRRLIVTNESAHERRLFLATYAEVALARPDEDERHPAFAKLFVDGEVGPAALMLRRRPRAAGDVACFLAHTVVSDGAVEGPVRYESDRARFVGRTGSLADPEVLRDPDAFGGARSGAPLDPILAAGVDVWLAPGASTELCFLTAVGHTRDGALSAFERYRRRAHVSWAVSRSRLRAERALHTLGLSPADAARAARLASIVAYPRPWLRAERAIAENDTPQSELWALGLSGDAPIVLVRSHGGRCTSLLSFLVRAHAWLARRTLTFDLVVLDARSDAYDPSLDDELARELSRTGAPSGVVRLREDTIPLARRRLLAAAACATFEADASDVEAQLARSERRSGPRLPPFPRVPSKGAEAATPACALPPAGSLESDDGYGGFDEGGREYVIRVSPELVPPEPWINVLANERFGCLVSERSLGVTWSGNAGENRLTPWSNDPVLDPPSEAIYLRDEETGSVWSPLAQGPADGTFEVRHRAGATRVIHQAHGVRSDVTVLVPLDATAKVVRLRLRNLRDRPRQLTVTYHASWVLGSRRAIQSRFVVPEFVGDEGALPGVALLARNPFRHELGGHVAFLAVDRPAIGVTSDREEFLGPHGDVRSPDALGRVGLSGLVAAGRDPCATITVATPLAPGATETVTFVLGEADERDAALGLAARFASPAAVDDAEAAVDAFWDETCAAVSVETPDRSFDRLVGRWLPLQTLACRVWGRTAFHQSSGAFGFRDQLQDVLALLFSHPDLARAHILAAAARQFEEGDVLHWWHPPRDRGVRTRCSDDLVWLPWAVAHWVEATGDRTILDEVVSYLHAPPLEDEEDERYARYEPGGERGPLYEHCLRAFGRAARTGLHGLPLIGTGDWNDGMNRVGERGRGESVWLAWFLTDALRRFAPLCRARGDDRTAEAFEERATALVRAVEEHAWDGDRYLRAFDDEGRSLGAADAGECAIDAITQAWAVLSGAADPERARVAMDTVARELVGGDGLVRLLAPPFDEGATDPGYIQGYPPGVRENGGQYAHAAVWVGWAFAELGDGGPAYEVFRRLDPSRRAATKADADLYRIEPYVLAGDVAGAPPHVGRGGWSWYTGSAGWTWRFAVERILGIALVGGRVRVDPCLPPDWPRCRATLARGGGRLEIEIVNESGAGRGVAAAELDGAPIAEPVVDVPADGEARRLVVRLGG